MGEAAAHLEQIVRAARLPDGPSAAAFGDYLRRRFADGANVGALEDDRPDVAPCYLHGALGDLYLVFACVSGSRVAASRVGRAILDVSVASRRLHIPKDVEDDAKQIVFEYLLRKDAASSKIGTYDGRGSLGAWLRVIVAREASRLHRARSERPDATVDELVKMAAPEDDPELLGLKSELRAKYRLALERAAQSLTSRERALLRQHLVLGMSVDALGPVYGVHRATVARWITAAKDALLERFYLELRKITGLRRAEAERIRSLIQSRLDLSLASLLESRPASAAP